MTSTFIALRFPSPRLWLYGSHREEHYMKQEEGKWLRENSENESTRKWKNANTSVELPCRSPAPVPYCSLLVTANCMRTDEIVMLEDDIRWWNVNNVINQTPSLFQFFLY
jgi:hypothetical protein